MMQPLLLLIAVLTLHLCRTQPQRDTSNAHQVAARRVSDHSRFAVMPNLGRHLSAGRTKTSRSAAATDAERCAIIGPRHLTVGTHLGGALLCQESGIFKLSAVAPDRGLLFPQEGDVAGGLGRARGARAARAGSPDVGGGRGLVGGWWHHAAAAGDGAEGVDACGPALVVHRGLGEMSRHGLGVVLLLLVLLLLVLLLLVLWRLGLLEWGWEDVGGGRPRTTVRVWVGGIHDGRSLCGVLMVLGVLGFDHSGGHQGSAQLRSGANKDGKRRLGFRGGPLTAIVVEGRGKEESSSPGKGSGRRREITGGEAGLRETAKLTGRG